jgi:nicotinate-nucleotide pyrophosphorylase (carboxylating)
MRHNRFDCCLQKGVDMDVLGYSPGIDRLIDLAIEEDLGGGDITTDGLIPPYAMGQGVIMAKERLVICGLPHAERVFLRIDPQLQCTSPFAEGDSIAAGQTVMTISGRLASLLRAERTALNFLQRLSGVATHVRAFVALLADSTVRLTDTRKTTPGWRALEKYAVRIGGATNHRMGLYDGILIKDNHIAACGGITSAITLSRARASHLLKIEVETSTLDDVKEALAAGADVIMLDNMELSEIRAAVALVAKRVPVEVSGGVTIERLAELAAAGVDLISAGALTHSARAVDLSMRIAHNAPKS